MLTAGAEALILFSSLYAAGLLVFGTLDQSIAAVGPLAVIAALFTLVVMICLLSMGLYQFNHRIDFQETAGRVFVGVTAGAVFLAIILAVSPLPIPPLMTAAIAICYSVSLLLIFRYWLSQTLDENRFRRRILLYGSGGPADAISSLRRRADRRGFKIVRRIDTQDVIDAGESGGSSLIQQIAKTQNIDEIVVAVDDRRGNLPIRELLEARLSGVNVIDIVQFLERESGKIRVDLVRPGWLAFGSGFRRSTLRNVTKRTLDIIASGVALLVSWPIMILVSLAIKIEDGLSAPVLYRQVRVGLDGATFTLLKFRSMRVDAESAGEALWAEESDPRITHVGRFIRRYRLDELPQIFNVLRGDMSMVGPRPERPEFVGSLAEKIPYYAVRHSVKAGVTGWAQLKYPYGASERDALEKLQFDLYYVKHHDLLFDLAIILQTVEVVLWGRGSR